jgi:hypothetical protein
MADTVRISILDNPTGAGAGFFLVPVPFRQRRLAGPPQRVGAVRAVLVVSGEAGGTQSGPKHCLINDTEQLPCLAGINRAIPTSRSARPSIRGRLREAWRLAQGSGTPRLGDRQRRDAWRQEVRLRPGQGRKRRPIAKRRPTRRLSMKSGGSHRPELDMSRKSGGSHRPAAPSACDACMRAPPSATSSVSGSRLCTPSSATMRPYLDHVMSLMLVRSRVG